MTREEDKDLHIPKEFIESLDKLLAQDDMCLVTVGTVRRALDRDYIEFPKGTLKKRGKDYVVYNYAWLKENWQTELKVMGIECEDCISRQAVLCEIDKRFDLAKPFKQLIKSMPPVTPKPKTDVLDKIRTEIKEESKFCPLTEGLERALEIIDKYKVESED